MRELEREDPAPRAARPRLTVIGPGRLGSALVPALRDAGWNVEGPLSREERPAAEPRTGEPLCFLLCVPDGEIAAAARTLPRGALLGHCSGAATLAPLAPHEAFSCHPLMTVTRRGARFAGAGAAIAGTSPRAREVARELAVSLQMVPFTVAEPDRALYHAAASVASNFLVTLEGAAEQLASTAGVPRTLLAPLVRATVENWAELGAGAALTGPVARGDEATVRDQRAAIADRAPHLLALFEALVLATRQLAAAGAAA